MHLGGGLCDITNFRTLCTICHMRVTKEQATRRAQMRAAGNTRTITSLFSSQNDSNATRKTGKGAKSREVSQEETPRSSKRRVGTLMDALAQGGGKRLAGGRRRGHVSGQKRWRGAVQATLMHGGAIQVGACVKPGSHCGSAAAAQSGGSGGVVIIPDSDSDFETDDVKLLRPAARGERAALGSQSTEGEPGGCQGAQVGIQDR